MDAGLEEYINRKLEGKYDEIWRKPDCAETGWLHYTNPRGFSGIIESSQIWCTEIRCVNDQREGDYGMDVIHSVVVRKPVHEEFKEKASRCNDLFGLKRNWTIYIASFCSGGEQAHMWHDYACRSTGCGIEFKYEALYAGAQQGSNYSLFPIIYGRLDQEERIEEMLDFAMRLELEMDLRGPNRREFWFSSVARALTLCAVHFKDAIWEAEQEQRIAVLEPAVPPIPANSKPRKAVSFDRKALTRVITGEYNEYNSNHDALREYLRPYGYGSDLRISSATV